MDVPKKIANSKLLDYLSKQNYFIPKHLYTPQELEIREHFIACLPFLKNNAYMIKLMFDNDTVFSISESPGERLFEILRELFDSSQPTYPILVSKFFDSLVVKLPKVHQTSLFNLLLENIKQEKEILKLLKRKRKSFLNKMENFFVKFVVSILRIIMVKEVKVLLNVITIFHYMNRTVKELL